MNKQRLPRLESLVIEVHLKDFLTLQLLIGMTENQNCTCPGVSFLAYIFYTILKYPEFSKKCANWGKIKNYGISFHKYEDRLAYLMKMISPQEY